MSFSFEWDERYSADTHMSIWPWSDLVSYVMRYVRPNSAQFKVLELGCGAGANIPFFTHLGAGYYAIEGSPTVVKKLQERFPKLKNNIVIGDFTQDIPYDEIFDLVVDRASLTHNTTSAIENALSIVYDKIKPGGKFIGIDWFSTEHTDFRGGGATEDYYTRKNYTDGQFAHVGCVHFSDKKHLQELFAAFEIEIMELKIVQREVPEDNYIFASWNLVAGKREKE